VNAADIMAGTGIDERISKMSITDARKAYAQTEMLIEILASIIEEAKIDGDERWRNIIPQIEALTERRNLAIARLRVLGELPAPPQITITANTVNTSTEVHNGRG